MLLHDALVTDSEVRKMDMKSSQMLLKRRFSENIFLNNLPTEELEILTFNPGYATMEFHSPVPFEHFDSTVKKTESSEFHSEDYLEYRRRVFEELASEYNKLSTVDEFQQHEYVPNLIPEILGDYHISDMHDFSMSPTSPTAEFNYGSRLHSANDATHEDVLISIQDIPDDMSPQQPTWDDSDLQTEPIASTQLLNQSHHSNSENFRTNLLALSEDNDLDERMHDFKFGGTQWDAGMNEPTIPAMHWTEMEQQLENMTKHQQEQSNTKGEEIYRSRSQFSPTTKRHSSRSALLKQKNDRAAILQKLSMGDPEVDGVLYGSDKPWYQPRLERKLSGNNQNLQICYINDSCSSSDEENSQSGNSDSKTSPSTKTSSTGGKSSPTSSPVLSSPGFGTRRNFAPIRMSSSSSTVSLSSTSSAGGHYTSSSSLPGDGEVISIRSSVQSDIPKTKTRQEELELQARIAITQAHQEARRQAEEERRRNRKGSKSSIDRLLQVPLDDATRLKVKTRALSKGDCRKMTVGQLQVILNDMHSEKEVLNSELMLILESRDELKMEQDAKLVDVEDMKSMMTVTGPETTV